MADKDKKEPPAEDGFERMAEGEARAETRRFGETRRRLPLAALGVLLALIGIGIYVAWPSILDSVQSTAPEEVATAAAPEPVQVTELEPPPAAIEAPAPPPEPSPALIALTAQVAALERALAERDAAPAPPPPDLTPVADAMARLEHMEQRLNEAPPAAVPQFSAPSTSESDTAAAALDFQTLKRLDAVESALSALDASTADADFDALRAGQAALGEQVAALRRLNETAGEREAASGRTMMLVLSFSRLTRAAAVDAPFAREVDAFSAAVGSEGTGGLALENAIRELSAPALGGTPTPAQLAAGFDDVALAVIHAAAEAEDQGWVDSSIGRLRRIVTVRRVGGDITADSLEGRLRALYRALAGGDLAQAISLAEALPAKARGGAEEWLQGARARLAEERALGTLDVEISARVAARWQAGEPEGE